MKNIFLGFLVFTAVLFSCQDDDVVSAETAPISEAIDDGNTILPNESLIIDILENDEIEDGTEIVYVDESTIEGVELILNDDGTYTYIPEEDFIGEDSFSYTICTAGVISEDTCSTGIVEIIVEPTNYTLTEADYELIVTEFGDVYSEQVANLEETTSFNIEGEDEDASVWSEEQLEEVLNFIVATNLEDAQGGDFFRVIYNVQDEEASEAIDNTVIEYEEVEETNEEIDLISYTLTTDDYDLVIEELTGVSGFENQVANLGEFGSFNKREGDDSMWSEEQLDEAFILILEENFPDAEEGAEFEVTYDFFDGSGGEETVTFKIVDGEFEEAEEKETEEEVIEIIVPADEQVSFNIPSELLNYYDDVVFSEVSDTTLNILQLLTMESHTTILTYGERHNYLYDADADLNNMDNVVLIYNSEVRADDEWLSGNNTNDIQTYNTEHVYPQSFLTDDFREADLHLLRAADSEINSDRGNDPFADGVEFGNTANGWYPGDEWKGDVARIVMYVNMYYDEPFTDVGDLELFLEWNVEDPVSDFELQRNEVIEGAQGNRNPFIDNPYLATLIWGGEDAENTWE